jgi:hypothetical protein
VLLLAGASSESNYNPAVNIMNRIILVTSFISLTIGIVTGHNARADSVPGSQSKPFQDEHIKTGPPTIPGIVQCALYDLGGAGVAYHDTDAINRGSGELNQQTGHQRPHASAYLWEFRKSEGVDISFVKDGADLNHTNLVAPHINQLYLGWTSTNEWCNYTVNVATPGQYHIRALYAHQTNAVRFDLNGKLAATCQIPLATPSYHHWNLAEIGTITFPTAGPQVLTFHYGPGNNFAYFEFVPAAAKTPGP